MKKEVLFLVIFALLGVAFGCSVYFNSKDEAGLLGLLGFDLLTSIVTFVVFECLAVVCSNGKKYEFGNVIAGVLASLSAVGICYIV